MLSLLHPKRADRGAFGRSSPLAPRSMTRRFSLALVLLLATLVTARPVMAQAAARSASPSLVVAALNMTAEHESPRSARTSVRPNDVLRYTLTFTNPTSRALGNVELKNPIPAGVRFVAGSTHASRSDARVEFSADNGQSWSAQPMESVVVDDKPVVRAIPSERFTHIRWVVRGAVAPQATVTADFEARVGT
jgi:uncharacterized repeat protein (TIGR01451 family)